MKERENEIGTYESINKTLILVLLEAALVAGAARLIAGTFPGPRARPAVGGVLVFAFPLPHFLSRKTVRVLTRFQLIYNRKKVK